MFAALGTAFLCLGGILPLAMYACPILASAVLLPVRERCSRPVTWCCYAAIAILGTLLDADRESALLFVFLGYYPLLKPQLDAIARRPLQAGDRRVRGRRRIRGFAVRPAAGRAGSRI